MALSNSIWIQLTGLQSTQSLEGKLSPLVFRACTFLTSICSVGGNTGTVNSFAGLDPADLTGGVLNLTTLLEGNNLLCFVFEVLKFASPNALSGLYKTIAEPLEFVTNILAVPLLNVTCPAFQDLQMGGKPIWEALQDEFPGAMKSNRAF